jgi:putative glutamine amidotransferase
MRPLIALPARLSATADTWRVPTYSAGQPYCDAIVRAGGIPVILTPNLEAIAALPEVLSRFDGVCLMGGPDIDPERYGATERHETLYGVRSEHDEHDLELVRVALALDIPLLAICRGHQALNVALGGTLHQHITDDETTVAHRYAMHASSVVSGSRLQSIVGNNPVGHSVHHQSVDRVGDGLRVVARGADGVIEGLEHTSRWAVGVQWHPEDSALVDPAQQALFDALVAEARSRPRP